MTWTKRISEETHLGTTTHQGVPGVADAPWCLVVIRCTPSDVICIKNSEIFTKNCVKFSGHFEHFYFWVSFIAQKIQKTG